MRRSLSPLKFQLNMKLSGVLVWPVYLRPLYALDVQIKACTKLKNTIDEHLKSGDMQRSENVMDSFRKDIKLMKDKMRIIDDILEFGVDL